MRLWSLDPFMMDRAGLVACWREALLAQAVLWDDTKGYKNHPQLDRFRAAADPRGAISLYLTSLAAEARDRGYRFNQALIRIAPAEKELVVTRGQLVYEFERLCAKVAHRDPDWYVEVLQGAKPICNHTVFTTYPGAIESWERVEEK